MKMLKRRSQVVCAVKSCSMMVWRRSMDMVP